LTDWKAVVEDERLRVELYAVTFQVDWSISPLSALKASKVHLDSEVVGQGEMKKEGFLRT
jgi:hypothetical protein